AGGGAAGGLSRGRGRAGGGGWDTPWPGGTRPPPPRPPSPPLGPPRGTYFSRRKLRQPLPPSPALTLIVARSTNMNEPPPPTSGPRPGVARTSPLSRGGRSPSRGHSPRRPVS